MSESLYGFLKHIHRVKGIVFKATIYYISGGIQMRKKIMDMLICVLIGILCLIPTNFAEDSKKDEVFLNQQVLTANS